ncbi:hypothetical protein D3C72_768820 [compost metagenome]
MARNGVILYQRNQFSPHAGVEIFPQAMKCARRSMYYLTRRNTIVELLLCQFENERHLCFRNCELLIECFRPACKNLFCDSIRGNQTCPVKIFLLYPHHFSLQY